MIRLNLKRSYMKFVKFGAAALIVALSAPAFADTLTVGNGPNATTNPSGGNPLFTDTPAAGAGFTPFVGYHLTVGTTTVTSGAAAGEFLTSYPGLGSFASYCLDINTDLHAPSAYATTILALDDVAKLFKAAGFNGQSWATDGVSGTQTAALQVAIWEVMADGLSGSNLGDGSLSFFQINAGVKSQANTYLAAAKNVTAGSYTPYVREFLSTVSGEKHSQPLVTTVPEPSTYALMAACLGVVGLVSRRKSA
jgi:hypothetical protein